MPRYRDRSSSSDSSETSTSFEDTVDRKRISMTTRLTQEQPKSPSKKYPTHHSFIVDMNNRPLYEMEKRPSPTKQKSTQTEVKPKVPQPTTHLPSTNSVPYYPPKSPFGQPKKSLWRMRRVHMCCLVCGLVLLLVVLFVVLGVVVDTNSKLNDFIQRLTIIEDKTGVTSNLGRQQR